MNKGTMWQLDFQMISDNWRTFPTSMMAAV